MRILNETEMAHVAGGVDPLPATLPEPAMRPDKEDVYWLMHLWSISRPVDTSASN